jgi:hypothetical protein
VYVYGLTQLKVVFIVMYLQHLSYMFRPFFHRAIIRLVCEEIFLYTNVVTYHTRSRMARNHIGIQKMSSDISLMMGL